MSLSRAVTYHFIFGKRMIKKESLQTPPPPVACKPISQKTESSNSKRINNERKRADNRQRSVKKRRWPKHFLKRGRDEWIAATQKLKCKTEANWGDRLKQRLVATVPVSPVKKVLFDTPSGDTREESNARWENLKMTAMMVSVMKGRKRRRMGG